MLPRRTLTAPAETNQSSQNTTTELMMPSDNDARGNFKIPPELFEMIYELVLVAPRPLCPCHELGRVQDPFAPAQPMFNTSLLSVSRKIYITARSSFYRKNQLNYTILPQRIENLQPSSSHPPRSNYLLNMSYMTWISMSYTYTRNLTDNECEANIGKYLQHMVDHCPLLRTFTLTMHRDNLKKSPLVGKSGNGGILSYIFRPHKAGTLDVPVSIPETLLALLQLPQLERFTMVAPVPVSTSDLATPIFIAPEIYWIGEFDGRGDEMDDLSAGAHATATNELEVIDLRNLTSTSWDDQEELRTWTYRPREEDQEVLSTWTRRLHEETPSQIVNAANEAACGYWPVGIWKVDAVVGDSEAGSEESEAEDKESEVGSEETEAEDEESEAKDEESEVGSEETEAENEESNGEYETTLSKGVEAEIKAKPNI